MLIELDQISIAEVDHFCIVGNIKGLAYKKTSEYEANVMVTHANENKQVNNESMAKKLRELKALLDDEIITNEEFKTQKKRILDGS